MENIQAKNQILPVVLEHDKNGWYAECPLLQGCYAQGDSYEEVIKNIEEVILLCLEDEHEKGETIEPTEVLLSTVTVPAFA
jgi:predicted RNase H-like HicB family nuclease